MPDFYLILTPVLILLVVALVGFVGCDEVWDIEPVYWYPPLNLKAEAGNKEVILDWDPPSSGNPTGYRVKRSEAMGGPYEDIADVATDEHTDSDPALVNGITYWYTVTTLINGEEKGLSEPVDATPSSPGIAFVESFTPGMVRNNFSGWVGMRIAVGAAPLILQSLGRACLPNNFRSHNMKVVDAATGMQVASTSVTMNPASAGQFIYAPPVAAVTLAPGGSYYIVSEETDLGDQFYDFDTVLQTTNVATVTNAGFSPDGMSFNPIGGLNNCFGPVDFTY